MLSGCSSQSKKVDKQSAASYNAQLGARYLQTGRLTLANEKLEKALKQDPNSSEVNHYYALLQQQIGNNKTATQHFKKAVTISQKDPNLLNNYGSHLCQTGHYLQAVKQFDLASQSPFYKTPEFAYTNAGICLRKRRNDKRAERYFRKALDKNTNFGSALFQMAKLNYDQGNFAKAQAFLLRYDEHNPPAVESLTLCTKINKRLGDINKADACAEKKLLLFQSKG
jgi:type IV pilus assembly protein PilF